MDNNTEYENENNIDIDKYCSELLLENNSFNNSTLFKSFQFFMKYLYLYSNILKLNKDQLINIKKIIDKFRSNESSKSIRFSEFELNIILKYPDYIKFNFDNTQIESLIIKITSNHLNNLSNSKYLFYWKGATYFEYIVNNILNLDDHQFKIELSNKVITMMIEFVKKINRNKFYYNSLIIGLLSFYELLGIEGYQEYSNDIIDFFDSSEFSAYNRDNFEIYINQIVFLIRLISNNKQLHNSIGQSNNNNNQKIESLYLKIVNCGRKKVQSNRDIVNFKEIILNYFKRIEKEEFESKINSGDKNNDGRNIQIMDKLDFIIQVLVDNGVFHENNFMLFLKDFKQLLVKLNIISTRRDIGNKLDKDNGGEMVLLEEKNEIDKSIINFNIKRIITVFKELPINEILKILNQLLEVFQISNIITSSQFLKKYLVYLDIDNYSQLINIFKINEDDIQNKEILKAAYDHSFNYLKRSSTLELSLGTIFKQQQQHINNSVVLKEYLISKLPYLINQLNIAVIDEYILPVFNNECHSLINYRNKVIYNSNSNNNNNNNSNNQIPVIPYYLITNIIYYLINNKLIYSFEKLNLVMVNRKFFEITSRIMNLSLCVPLDIYYHYHALEIQGLCNGSIIKPLLVKYLKIKLSNIVRPLFYILEAFKSLQVLEISGFIDDEILYKKNFKNNKLLERIIIKCSFYDAKKSAQALQLLGKHFTIELYLFDDYIPEHKIQMKMVKQLSMELNTLFKFYNDSKLSKLSQFSLIVNSINHSLAKNFNSSLYIEKQKRIKNLEFLLLYNGSLDVLFSYFKSLKNLRKLSFKLYTNDMNNIESTVSDIFRIFGSTNGNSNSISGNENDINDNCVNCSGNINHPKIEEIKITDQNGYSLDINWSLINCLNFKDLELNNIYFYNQNINNQNLDDTDPNDISDEEDYYI